jgi:hypothetical protein
MDWADIKHLTENEALQIVKDYFSKHGFSCDYIDTTKVAASKKSPDFEVSKGGQMVFYCEVKTPEHKLNPVTKMYHWDTTFYKLRRFLHTAVKQFQDFDPDHKYPHIVAFTSNHPQLNWTNFRHNVMGAVAYNGDVIRDFRNVPFVKDSNKDLLSIDMILWFQVNYLNKTPFQTKHFVNIDLPLFNQTNEISNSLTLEIDEKIIS